MENISQNYPGFIEGPFSPITQRQIAASLGGFLRLSNFFKDLKCSW